MTASGVIGLPDSFGDQIAAFPVLSGLAGEFAWSVLTFPFGARFVLDSRKS
jgi:hypothetical protein